MTAPSEDLYAVIGCPKEASCDQILAEYRKKVLDLHPDKLDPGAAGDVKEGNCRRFQQLQFAKDVLSDPKRRHHYELWLAMGSEMALKEWMESQGKIQQTIHWGQHCEPVVRQLTQPDDSRHHGKCWREPWQSHNSPTTRAFRDYRI